MGSHFERGAALVLASFDFAAASTRASCAFLPPPARPWACSLNQTHRPRHAGIEALLLKDILKAGTGRAVMRSTSGRRLCLLVLRAQGTERSPHVIVHDLDVVLRIRIAPRLGGDDARGCHMGNVAGRSSLLLALPWSAHDINGQVPAARRGGVDLLLRIYKLAVVLHVVKRLQSTPHHSTLWYTRKPPPAQ